MYKPFIASLVLSDHMWLIKPSGCFITVENLASEIAWITITKFDDIKQKKVQLGIYCKHFTPKSEYISRFVYSPHLVLYLYIYTYMLRQNKMLKHDPTGWQKLNKVNFNN